MTTLPISTNVLRVTVVAAEYKVDISKCLLVRFNCSRRETLLLVPGYTLTGGSIDNSEFSKVLK